MDVLEASPYSVAVDKLLRIHIEELLIIEKVYKALGPAQTILPLSFEARCQVCLTAFDELHAWYQRWFTEMANITQFGDNMEVKSSIPFHHGRLTVLSFFLSASMSAQEESTIRSIALTGMESAIMMLRFGVESRIWLPSSSAAQYLQCVERFYLQAEQSF